MVIGVISMVIISCVLNGVLLLPAYGKAFKIPVEAFIEMGSEIIPVISNMLTFCLFCVAPFNLLKGIVVSGLTLILYKHISRLLKGKHNM